MEAIYRCFCTVDVVSEASRYLLDFPTNSPPVVVFVCVCGNIWWGNTQISLFFGVSVDGLCNPCPTKPWPLPELARMSEIS
jgi:hypothetical protein